MLVFGGNLTSITSTSAESPTQQNTPLSIQIFPSSEIPQGTTGLIRIRAANLTKLQGTFQEQFINFYPTIDRDWVGFIAASMEGERGVFPLDIYAWFGDSDTPERTRIDINVAWGGFPREDIALPYNLSNLLDPEVNAQETELLERIHNRTTPVRLFTSFIYPVSTPRISNFGGYRTYNGDQLTGRHTGVDYRANSGDAISAPAHGRVIFSSHIPIRGNHIVIDHGWGILTGYSHLSEAFVVPGQIVRQGEIIGLAGTTGRSQGAHLHWEMIVNGRWVDVEQFLTLAIPPELPPQ
jgi:murein DD-endopeptidase MepM/ murein hydrolase activator NlpD